MKILIVDDQTTMRKVLSKIIQELGFNHIVEADDGDTALAKLGEEKIDVIISDIHMERMSGIELLKNVRENPDLKEIPFIIATTENVRKSVMEAIKLGVSDYFLKPYSHEIIKSKLINIGALPEDVDEKDSEKKISDVIKSLL